MKLTRYNPKVSVYTLEESFSTLTPVRGFKLEIKNPRTGQVYAKLMPSGKLTLLEGYTWNGCSPKFTIGSMVFGTPEGDLNLNIMSLYYGKPKTYFGSAVHDALYQFSDYNLFEKSDRKVVDLLFKQYLSIAGFKNARLYYRVVRLTGWMFWGKKTTKEQT